MHCKNIANWTRFALAFLFVISSNTQAFCLPAAQVSLQALQAHTKLHGASEILADFHQGAPETRVIVTLQPSPESAALETESLQPDQLPEKIRKPGAPAYYNLKNKSIRKRLRTTVSEQINRVTNTIGPQGVKVANRFRYQFGFSAIVTPEGLEKIVSNPDVLAVEKDLPQYPHLAQGVPLMNALSTRTTFDGTGISIAVTDTGIDTSHPNLGGGGFPIFNSKVIGGYDTGDDDDDPTPGKNGEAHGTACAGIAGGDNTGTVGDYIGGVAPGVKLYALKISTGTTGSAWSGDVVDAWEWIIDHQDDDPDNPIMIISHSFGGGRYYSACDSDLGYYATAAANANAAGITIFASAGNDGWCDSMGAPACISSINSVGAVYDADIGGWGFCVDAASCGVIEEYAGCSTGWIAWDTGKSSDMVTGYSNSASFLNMFAPSNSAHTTDIADRGGYNTSKSPAGDYTTEGAGFGGTSAACPYAAGAAAVLQQAAMERTGTFLTPAEVQQYLVNNGDNVTDSKPSGLTRPRVNLGNAIAAIIPTIYSLTVSRNGSGNGTVTSSPAGIDCGIICSHSFAADSIVTLTANAGLESTFIGWSGESCSGTGTCQVTMDAAKSVTATFALTCYKDLDQDGYGSTTIITDNGDGVCLAANGESAVSTDCNDSNGGIHPGATETVADGVDQDCNTQELCFADLDNDNYRPDESSTVISADLDCSDSTEALSTEPIGDCNDSNSSIYPGAIEIVADGVDQDCDALELCYVDLDNDGYRPDTLSTIISIDLDCIDSAEAISADPTGDCNDANEGIHPGATELVADGIDQDCDSRELCYADIDNDGYRPDHSSTVGSADLSCLSSGKALPADPTGDCNDQNSNVYPGAEEIVADGLDQDCNGSELCYQDSDNDQYGSLNTIIDNGNLVCIDTNESTVNTDCDDENSEVNPGASEICDRKDNNCDNQIDENNVCSERFWLLMAPAIINGGTSR